MQSGISEPRRRGAGEGGAEKTAARGECVPRDEFASQIEILNFKLLLPRRRLKNALLPRREREKLATTKRGSLALLANCRIILRRRER